MRPMGSGLNTAKAAFLKARNVLIEFESTVAMYCNRVFTLTGRRDEIREGKMRILKPIMSRF